LASKFAGLNLALDTALPQHNWDRTLVNTVGEQKLTGESQKHYQSMEMVGAGG
jgi:hypothetical protein